MACDVTMACDGCHRFSYCAVLCCAILGRMDALNIDNAVNFIVQCTNFDGGFGCTPGELQLAVQLLAPLLWVEIRCVTCRFCRCMLP